MGLTSFKGAKVRKSDVTVAKNYMDLEEISTLNLIVNMYLDYAELQAKQHRAMHMAGWGTSSCSSMAVKCSRILEPLSARLPKHLQWQSTKSTTLTVDPSRFRISTN